MGEEYAYSWCYAWVVMAGCNQGIFPLFLSFFFSLLFFYCCTMVHVLWKKKKPFTGGLASSFVIGLHRGVVN